LKAAAEAQAKAAAANVEAVKERLAVAGAGVAGGIASLSLDDLLRIFREPGQHEQRRRASLRVAELSNAAAFRNLDENRRPPLG
jgi:hypothetical protein